MTRLSPRLQAVVDALPLQPGSRVLEIGCGPGAAARAIANRLDTGHILAIDRSAKAIDQARANAAERDRVRPPGLPPCPGRGVRPPARRGALRHRLRDPGRRPRRSPSRGRPADSHAHRGSDHGRRASLRRRRRPAARAHHPRSRELSLVRPCLVRVPYVGDRVGAVALRSVPAWRRGAPTRRGGRCSRGRASRRCEPAAG